ncbi:50S ribosomal protein L9 [Devosia sp. RR2S18]|jgi:large subunit ribosomal protein L9|uniref:50S ribosomal protein L9 n=1 Tax=Devosia rhizosphaerae TaxID=3049774 RepID=UPI00254030FD|nr:50S ribosomal protein L9 [Devosia sp. RR2S18]WIJ24193.1 50S ribosomal protein L9 [Devosia sp. RR2S18]HEV7291679.1 50S ribosomal protein L9 [Devosia sp.]
MKVILLERVGRTGAIGDEVVVKDGFARNFLLPQGKALRATEANRAKFASERANIEQRNEERRRSATGIAEGLNGKAITLIRQAAETGQLYGSVAARDIVEALASDGYTVQRSQVDLTDPIKSVGLHTVALNLHPEVAVSITVNVARSDDEAVRQAAGEDVTITQFEVDEDSDFAAGQADAASDDRFDDAV